MYQKKRSFSLRNPKDIEKIPYVEFMALINESNRAPGGSDSIRRIALNSFLNKKSYILHIGCNTGLSTRQIIRFIKCKGIGIDLSELMIKAAKGITKEEKLNKYIKFYTCDARKTSFPDETFDLVFSPGSIAFMDNRREVLKEAMRVLKLYGFYADIPMYYKKSPPQKLIDRLNLLLGIQIQKWDLSFWEETYNDPQLELTYKYIGDFEIPDTSRIKAYCNKLCNNLNYPNAVRNAIEARLYETMKLFSENHKYLGYSVLIYQKVFKKEQISLFGK